MYSIKGNSKTYQVDFSSKTNFEGTIDGNKFVLDIFQESNNKYHLIFNNKSYNIEVLIIDRKNKSVEIKLDNTKHKFSITDKYDALLKEIGIDISAANKVSEIKAPMPGLVLDIMVTDSQEVKVGDPLMVLEAMKMENVLKSPIDGVIKHINISKGIAVEKNEVLLQFN